MGGKGSGRRPGEGAIPKPITWIKDGDCVICTSHARNAGGYPLIKRRGRFMALCRHILFRRYGGQSSKIVSRHTCDRKACINPDHIIPGTNSDNLRDRDERSLLAYGERIGNSKLKENEVREIRRLCDLKILPREIAPKFNVSMSLVKMIRRREIWKRCV